MKVSDPEVKTLSLAELGLSPSSVLLVRFQSEAYNSERYLFLLEDLRIIGRCRFLPGTTLPPPLLPQILEQAVGLPGSADAEEPAAEDLAAAPKPTPRQPTAASTGEKKVPKWFKMGPNAKK